MGVKNLGAVTRMAEYKFNCYRCGQHLACEESLSGTQIQCPVCQALLLVPFFGVPPTAAPTAGIQSPAVVTPQRRGRVKLFIDLALALIAIGAAVWVLIDDAKKRERYRALTSLGAVYDQMQSYQDKIAITQEVEVEGRKRLHELSASLLVRKPDKVNLRVKSEQGEVQMVCDGQKTWTYVSIFENQYVSREADKISDNFIRLLNHSWLGLQGALDYYEFVLAGDAQKLFKKAKNLKFGGRVLLNGKPAYLMTWEFQPTPFRLAIKAWIDPENGLILKMIEDFTVVASELAKLGPYTIVNTNILKVTTAPSGVRLGETIADDQFGFQRPAASKSVEHFQLTSLLARRTNPLFSDELLERLIPPRSRQAKPGMIDLTKYYNAPLVASWHAGLGNDLSTLPAGIQKFVGVEFDIRGLIQLSGGEVGVRYPEDITGIKARLKSSRLHFLHAAGWNLVNTGTKIGSYWVRYADGKRKEIPIVYGQDVVNWWNSDGKLPTQSVVAWTGQNAASRAQGRLIRLFCSTWTNPFPELEIESIDFVSSLVNSAPFLVAITADYPAGQRVAQVRHAQDSPLADWSVDADGTFDLKEIFTSVPNTTNPSGLGRFYDDPL